MHHIYVHTLNEGILPIEGIKAALEERVTLQSNNLIPRIYCTLLSRRTCRSEITQYSPAKIVTKTQTSQPLRDVCATGLFAKKKTTKINTHVSYPQLVASRRNAARRSGLKRLNYLRCKVLLLVSSIPIDHQGRPPYSTKRPNTSSDAHTRHHCKIKALNFFSHTRSAHITHPASPSCAAIIIIRNLLPVPARSTLQYSVFINYSTL